MQWLKDWAASAKSTMAKYNNSTFKNAAMATCALIAAADGEIEKEEKAKVAKLIQNNEMLQVFDAVELRDLFLQYADKAADEFGRMDVMNVVARLKGNAEQSETCVQIALVIANADGDFEPQEKKVVTEICGRLGIAAERFVS